MLSLEQCPGPEEVGPEEVGPEEVQEQRECTRWRKGGVAGGRSRVGHRNVLGHWWT